MANRTLKISQIVFQTLDEMSVNSGENSGNLRAGYAITRYKGLKFSGDTDQKSVDFRYQEHQGTYWRWLDLWRRVVMLERFLLATVATGSLSLLVHGMPQITGISGQPLDLNAELSPSSDPETTKVSWHHADPIVVPAHPAATP